MKLDRAALDHRRFWDAMDRLGQTELREIETRLGRRMVTEFGLDLTGLALDMTNFATFIDTGNERAPIAQRGKAKQKRTDLRLVGLALVITRDGGVPVISHGYPGDRPDVTQFSTVVDELVTRYRDLVAGVESLTVVYDAGQNSRDNHAVIEAHGIGFVGSLPPSDHPDLLQIPARDYRPVDDDRYPGLSYVDSAVTALGVTRRAVLTHSANLHAKQSRGLDQTLAKARRRLADLAARLARGRTRRDRDQVQAEITGICKPRWVAEILTATLTATLTGDTPAELRLSWRTDAKARKRLEQRLFGKRILFTNRDWPVPDVVAAYRSQSDAEFGFRQLKDPHLVSFSPMHHWTDSKIRVHVFYCVLALAVAHLMRRHADHAGLHLSVRELLDELADIDVIVADLHKPAWSWAHSRAPQTSSRVDARSGFVGGSLVALSFSTAARDVFTLVRDPFIACLLRSNRENRCNVDHFRDADDLSRSLRLRQGFSATPTPRRLCRMGTPTPTVAPARERCMTPRFDPLLGLHFRNVLGDALCDERELARRLSHYR